MFKLGRSGKTDLALAISAFLFLIVLGTWFYVSAEGWSVVDAFYFSTTMIITIGHAELIPSTDFSKIFTAIFSVIGVTVFLALVALAAGEVLKKEKE